MADLFQAIAGFPAAGMTKSLPAGVRERIIHAFLSQLQSRLRCHPGPARTGIDMTFRQPPKRGLTLPDRDMSQTIYFASSFATGGRLCCRRFVS